jgi:hypothetical protein
VPRPWKDIAAFYRDLVSRGMAIQGMLHLTEQIEASRYATGIFGETSMHDLCVMQTDGAFWEGPHLKISPRFDGTMEFRYIDTFIREKQWHRVVKEDEAFSRLVVFFAQLHWFATGRPISEC